MWDTSCKCIHWVGATWCDTTGLTREIPVCSSVSAGKYSVFIIKSIRSIRLFRMTPSQTLASAVVPDGPSYDSSAILAIPDPARHSSLHAAQLRLKSFMRQKRSPIRPGPSKIALVASLRHEMIWNDMKMFLFKMAEFWGEQTPGLYQAITKTKFARCCTHKLDDLTDACMMCSWHGLGGWCHNSYNSCHNKDDKVEYHWISLNTFPLLAFHVPGILGVGRRICGNRILHRSQMIAHSLQQRVAGLIGKEFLLCASERVWHLDKESVTAATSFESVPNTKQVPHTDSYRYTTATIQQLWCTCLFQA